MVNILEVNHEVVLHQVSYSDAPALFRLIDNNRTSLRAWLPFVDFTKVVEDTEAFIGSLFVPGGRAIWFLPFVTEAKLRGADWIQRY